jgi:hypothetical protein
LLYRRGGGKCATIVLAIGVRGLVEALNAGLTQHHETAVELCQLVFAQNGFRIDPVGAPRKAGYHIRFLFAIRA